MKTRNQNKKNYSGKNSLKTQNTKETEPVWSKTGISLTFTTNNINKWINILASRYYNNLDPNTNVIHWNDMMDKHQVDVHETLINITTSVHMSVSITVYFTKNKIQIQGNSVKQWYDFEYPGLKQIYNTSANIPEEIDRHCREIFTNDRRFVVYAQALPEDVYVPAGIPSEVKLFLNEVVEMVCSEFEPKVKGGTKKKPPKTPKKPPQPKVSLEEHYARNVTHTVNKLDDRLTYVTDELRAEVISSVNDGLTRAAAEIQILINTEVASTVQKQLQELHRTTTEQINDTIKPLQQNINSIELNVDVNKKDISTINSLTINMKKVMTNHVQVLLAPLTEENKTLRKDLAALKEMVVAMKWNNATKTPRKATPPPPIRHITNQSPGRTLPTLPMKPIPGARPPAEVPAPPISSPPSATQVAPRPPAEAPVPPISSPPSATQLPSKVVPPPPQDPWLLSTAVNSPPSATQLPSKVAPPPAAQDPWLRPTVGRNDTNRTQAMAGTPNTETNPWLVRPAKITPPPPNNNTWMGSSHHQLQEQQGSQANVVFCQQQSKPSMNTHSATTTLSSSTLTNSSPRQQWNLFNPSQINNSTSYRQHPPSSSPPQQQLRASPRDIVPPKSILKNNTNTTQTTTSTSIHMSTYADGTLLALGGNHGASYDNISYAMPDNNTTSNDNYNNNKNSSYINNKYDNRNYSKSSNNENNDNTDNTYHNNNNTSDNLHSDHENRSREQHRQPDILVLMDSNRRDINFENLFCKDKVQVMACGTVEHAAKVVKDKLRSLPKTVLIHLRTNDLNKMSPQ